MNYFEYICMNFCLSIDPRLIWSKRSRTERKYVLNEIKQGRGIFPDSEKTANGK